jgi:hypothetical protein
LVNIRLTLLTKPPFFFGVGFGFAAASFGVGDGDGEGVGSTEGLGLAIATGAFADDALRERNTRAVPTNSTTAMIAVTNRSCLFDSDERPSGTDNLGNLSAFFD